MLAEADTSLAQVGDIPVFAARLPSADALLPYLRQIDSTGRYTNGGPLAASLERRLQQTLALPSGSVALASSGTAALQAAILVAAGRGRPGRDIAIIPGYTFAATAHAAQACGYELAFADVDPACWALSPDALLGNVGLHRAGVVIPVAPYGRSVDAGGWASFARSTGIPVVIDGAACFEAIARDPSAVFQDLPIVLSLHATKAFSTAEGGAVLWSDPAGIRRVTEALCFGFTDGMERSVAGPGLNGKLSEYHAAVGLACLDAFGHDADTCSQLCGAYVDAAALAGIEPDGLTTWPTIASSYALFMAPSLAAAETIIAAMARSRIGVRRWYGRGLHREVFFTNCQRLRLGTTESLADRLLGLPMFPGMHRDQMAAVFSTLQKSLHVP